ncbi:MAG TPA: translation initiation factor IF-2 N-terminal domain-containing protein, partial [Calidithermus sp.]|nr:translation initiation factor IF-2 N-terminal domain-containing protein [Calidithermus sp.]
MAAKIKVIELAKELGVTSKDLMLAAEEMGHKGVRAMTPLDSALANALRLKLGRGRELPEEAKPKRPARARKAAEAEPGAATTPRPPRQRKAKPAVEETPPAVELKPAATIVKPKPVETVPEPEPGPPAVEPAAEARPAPTPVVPPPAPEPPVPPR